MGESLEIERILDFVIALFPDENDQESVGEHTHNERKVDKAIRLIEEGGKGMNEERVIKVVYYGDSEDCGSNDRVSIEFSPNDISTLRTHFRKQALATDVYDAQTSMREMYAVFGRAFKTWDGYKGGNK